MKHTFNKAFLSGFFHAVAFNPLWIDDNGEITKILNTDLVPDMKGHKSVTSVSEDEKYRLFIIKTVFGIIVLVNTTGVDVVHAYSMFSYANGDRTKIVVNDTIVSHTVTKEHLVELLEMAGYKDTEPKQEPLASKSYKPVLTCIGAAVVGFAIGVAIKHLIK